MHSFVYLPVCLFVRYRLFLDIYIYNSICYSQVLQLQSEALERQKQEDLQLKEMEAEWLKEQQKMREEEEKFLKDEKLRKQQAAKTARQVSIRLKDEKEVRITCYHCLMVVVVNTKVSCSFEFNKLSI